MCILYVYIRVYVYNGFLFSAYRYVYVRVGLYAHMHSLHACALSRYMYLRVYVLIYVYTYLRNNAEAERFFLATGGLLFFVNNFILFPNPTSHVYIHNSSMRIRMCTKTYHESGADLFLATQGVLFCE